MTPMNRALSNFDLIEQIKKRNSEFNSPESALNQANALDTLSTDIYSDDKRFIYELLQNADDASCESGLLDIQIDLIEDYLVVSHRGEPFSEVDVESICSIGDGNKQGDENKTGFKGIGFKSVFSHSDYVILNSNNYCFRFDANYWNRKWFENWGDEYSWQHQREKKKKSVRVKMPWQIIPIPMELPAKFDAVKKLNFEVSTFIRLRSSSNVGKELKELFSDTQILLFLRSPRVKLRVNRNNSTILFIEKAGQSGKVQLKKDSNIQNEWLFRSFDFQIDNGIKKEMINDTRIPKKLREATKAEISFAIQIKDGKIKRVEKNERLIFTYLPTSVNYDFPFLVNASFLTDAGRQQLHEDWSWNQWLFEQIPLKLFTWLSELADKDSEFSSQFFPVIPQRLTRLNDLRVRFNRGYDRAIESIPFIPNLNGELLKVEEALFDKTNISQFIKKKALVEFINTKSGCSYSKKSLIPHLGAEHILKVLGVRFFEIEELKDFFESNNFKDEHSISENFGLIKFLFLELQNLPKEERRSWNFCFREILFILDEDENLKSPKQIFFPSIQLFDDFDEDICFVHPITMKQIESNRRIKKWLEYLGVKEPSDVSFIEKAIIGNDEYVTLDNAIEVGKYLFNAHKKGLLEDEHYQGFFQLYILTKENNLIRAQDSYLSDFYEPDFKLESVYGHDFYVSEEYYSSSDLKSEWKTFWQKIGVKETISWSRKTLKRWQLQSKFPDYFESIPSGAPNSMWGYKNDFYSYEFNLLSFIENTHNYDFSKKFWSIIFSSNLAIKRGSIDRGICYYPSNISSLNDWIIKHCSIFPSTLKKCEKAENVFINKKEIKEIAGKHLPVLDYEGSIPLKWLKYLPFKESLGLEDYLKILRKIWKNQSDEKEDSISKKQIGLIYEKLVTDYLDNLEELTEWGKNNKLLAKDGKRFFTPSELSVVTVPGFNAENLAYCDENNKGVIQLLQIFGVSIVDKVKPTFSNSTTEIQDLKIHLRHILPLIAVLSVEKSKSKKDWEKEYERLNKKLRKIKFFETTEIYLSYGNEEDKQKRSSWSEGNYFYYVGNWYKPRILDGLVEPLGRFLGIRYAERHLSVLLSDDFSEGIEYLKEKFGEEALDVVPEELLNPKQPQIKVVNAGNRKYNLSDEDLGRKGEMFVFEELKRIYTEKYGRNIEETESGFKIGDFLEVYWKNISQNTSSNYDFKIKENGTEIFIDSKATPYGVHVEKIPFYISSNEFILMEIVNRYLIARVYNVTTNPKMKLIKLKIDKLN